MRTQLGLMKTQLDSTRKNLEEARERHSRALSLIGKAPSQETHPGKLSERSITS